MEQPTATQRADSVARTLDIIGDRWSFLILREAFFGVKRYDGFQAKLGIATNILSARLKKLTAHGVFARSADPADGRKRIYRLTEKGLDLYDICLALMAWGDRWLAGDQGPPLVLTHLPCGAVLRPRMTCTHCGEPVDPRTVDYRHSD